MSSGYLRLVFLSFALLWLFCGKLPARAQQTIFNVPSPDVTPKGHVFLQHESQFRPWQPGAFWVGTHYAAVGIGLNTELDATLINVSAPYNDAPPVLGLGFKTAVPIFKERFAAREFKVVIGQLLPISLGPGKVGNWSYGTFSLRLPKVKTRLSGGYSTGTRHIFGQTTVGFIGTYEQPITKKLSLIGDWYSGTHSNGLFIPGFSYTLPKDVNLYCGFQIPNNSECGRTGFVMEIARIF